MEFLQCISIGLESNVRFRFYPQYSMKNITNGRQKCIQDDSNCWQYCTMSMAADRILGIISLINGKCYEIRTGMCQSHRYIFLQVNFLGSAEDERDIMKWLIVNRFSIQHIWYEYIRFGDNIICTFRIVEIILLQRHQAGGQRIWCRSYDTIAGKLAVQMQSLEHIFLKTYSTVGEAEMLFSKWMSDWWQKKRISMCKYLNSHVSSLEHATKLHIVL